MSQLKLFLFGNPHFERDGRIIELNLRKAIAILVYLAITKHAHSRDALAALFWPESDQKNSRASLRRTLYRLNQTFGEETFVATLESVGLNNQADVWVDTAVFQRLLTNHLTAEISAPDSVHLKTAVTLYTDDFLNGFTLPDCPEFDEWQFFQREEMRQLLAQGLVQLIEWHQSLGEYEYETAIHYGRRWLSLDPLHEPAHRYLMQLYYWSGQQAAALRQYDECVRLLADELGVTPEVETTALFEAIKTRQLPPRTKQKTDKLKKAPEPETAVKQPIPHNLPIQSTPFVGRETELDAVGELLLVQKSRLITIMGPGGMGKTRLALAFAERLIRTPSQPTFPDGVFFIDLAPLSDIEQIMPALVEALGIQLRQDTVYGRTVQEQTIEYLRSKQMLLILDNFEHLLDGVGFVSDILQHAPDVQLIATSRERLNLQSEQLYLIQGLQFPDWETPEDAAEYTAVQLFLQSARRNRADFVIQTGDDLTYLARICRLVAGMPLAIELAAAWVDVLTLEDIASEIENSLEFLETDIRDVPERHRSIAAAIESSWARLSDKERLIFPQLSVFRGGFTREAAELVAGANLRLLSRLVNKSFLQFEPNRTRYHIHELMRQFGLEKLQIFPTEAKEVQTRHSNYYCDLLQRNEINIYGEKGNHKGDNVSTKQNILNRDMGNFRTAWNWATDHLLIDNLFQANVAFMRLLDSRWLHDDAVMLFGRTIEQLKKFALRADSSQVLLQLILDRAGALGMLFRFEERLAHLKEAEELLEQLEQDGVDVRTEKEGLLFFKGEEAETEGDFQVAKQYYLQCLAFDPQFDHYVIMSGCFFRLANVATAVGDYEEAEHYLEKASELSSTEWSAAWGFDQLAYLKLLQGKFLEAKQYLNKSQEQFRKSKNPAGDYQFKATTAVSYYMQGKFKEADTLTMQILDDADLISPASNRRAVFTHLATQLHLGNCQEILEDLHIGKNYPHDIERWIIFAGLRNYKLGCASLSLKSYSQASTALQDSITLFRELGLLPDLTMALVVSSFVARKQNDGAEALITLKEALQHNTDIHQYETYLLALPITALLFADLGNYERAIELYALAWQQPHIANSRWFADVAGEELAAISEMLPADIAQAAQGRGEQLDFWDTAVSLLTEIVMYSKLFPL